jgi:hypothetical protein
MLAAIYPCSVARDIQEVLNRRSDLSTFVVHLSREFEGSPAKDNLRKIIAEGSLRAKTARGWARYVSDKKRGETQNVVCFTETPLDHIYLQAGPIKDREFQFQPYGIALTKMQARRRGINPVWYVDESPSGRDWTITSALNELLESAVGVNFQNSPLVHLLPFFEPMYRRKGRDSEWSTYEWWWEREWRHVGHFYFNPGTDVAFYLCPESDIQEFNALLEKTKRNVGDPPPPCIDPAWGLERILAHLLKLPSKDISPFAD